MRGCGLEPANDFWMGQMSERDGRLSSHSFSLSDQRSNRLRTQLQRVHHAGKDGSGACGRSSETAGAASCEKFFLLQGMTHGKVRLCRGRTRWMNSAATHDCKGTYGEVSCVAATGGQSRRRPQRRCINAPSDGAVGRMSPRPHVRDRNTAVDLIRCGICCSSAFDS